MIPQYAPELSSESPTAQPAPNGDAGYSTSPTTSAPSPEDTAASATPESAQTDYSDLLSEPSKQGFHKLLGERDTEINQLKAKLATFDTTKQKADAFDRLVAKVERPEDLLALADGRQPQQRQQAQAATLPTLEFDPRVVASSMPKEVADAFEPAHLPSLVSMVKHTLDEGFLPALVPYQRAIEWAVQEIQGMKTAALTQAQPAASQFLEPARAYAGRYGVPLEDALMIVSKGKAFEKPAAAPPPQRQIPPSIPHSVPRQQYVRQSSADPSHEEILQDWLKTQRGNGNGAMFE